MIKVTRTSIRPNTDSPFYIASQEFTDYFNLSYIETGKTTIDSVTFSDDTLTRTIILFWTSLEDMESSDTDPLVIDFLALKNDYNLENGITETVTRQSIEE
jgi:hypothetical protein